MLKFTLSFTFKYQDGPLWKKDETRKQSDCFCSTAGLRGAFLFCFLDLGFPVLFLRFSCSFVPFRKKYQIGLFFFLIECSDSEIILVTERSLLCISVLPCPRFSGRDPELCNPVEPAQATFPSPSPVLGTKWILKPLHSAWLTLPGLHLYSLSFLRSSYHQRHGLLVGKGGLCVRGKICACSWRSAHMC